MKLTKYVACSTLLLVCPALTFADFSYQQTTTITGGAMAGMMKMASAFSRKAGQPVVSTVLVKGDRMARLNANSGSVIDLDKETITHINFDKRTYSVMTFEQMRAMMQQVTESMNGGRNGSADVKLKVSSKETGHTQNISGYNAREMVFNVGVDATDAQSGQQGAMNVTSSIWVAPDVAGYGEVRAFHRRMAEKLGYLPEDQMPAMRQAGQGMVEISREMAKLDGVPLRTVTEMGGASGQGGPLFQSTTDAGGFSSAAVDESKFEVPAGFKQVESSHRPR